MLKRLHPNAKGNKTVKDAWNTTGSKEDALFVGVQRFASIVGRDAVARFVKVLLSAYMGI